MGRLTRKEEIMKRSWISIAAAFPFLLVEPAWPHEDETPPGGMPERLGQVNFPISCSAGAQVEFNRSVALLHSFYYPVAVKAFTHVTEIDPDCAMGYWGVAMSRWYPLWYPPTTASLEQGKAAVDKARSVGTKTERERGYIEAIGAFYQDFDRQSHSARARAYESAMQQLHMQFVEDREATAFYALAMQATIDPNDRTYAKQLKSASLLEPLFAEQPDHPGLAHYIIHAYDYPGLAPRALDAARRYGKIAPSVPHALHMPSHTFTYLGLWQDAIRSDTASAGTARKQGDTNSELHSMDYLVYAYLQSGEEQEAKSILDDLSAVSLNDKERTIAIDYTLAAAPARYAIELRRWSDAAALIPRPSRFPATEALTHYARALGAVHTGNLPLAREDVQGLAALRDVLLNAKNDYWAKQVEIQRLTASAWLAWVQSDAEAALTQMRAAADLEDSTYKHPVTPGQLVPARELLGDLLLELQRPAEALVEYQAALSVTPNRFNGVYGAARSAELAGDSATAKAYYSQLLGLCDKATSARPELQRARMVMAQN
jgi:tetratricopeptide (TPR) repeat protein